MTLLGASRRSPRTGEGRPSGCRWVPHGVDNVAQPQGAMRRTCILWRLAPFWVQYPFVQIHRFAVWL